MSSKVFPCRFPQCNAGYQRREHRHRHEIQHYRGQVFECTTCDQTFARRDTLRRHMRMIHDVEQPLRVKLACTTCRNQKARCQGGPPCANCLRRGLQCSQAQPESESRKPVSRSRILPATLPIAHLSPTNLRSSRSRDESHYINLYFQRFHPSWPLLHQWTFKGLNETPLLVQSMVIIGMWLSNEEDARPKAIALHDVLRSAVLTQTDVWDASKNEDMCNLDSWPIPTYQAILLHIIFAILFKDSGPLCLDLRPSLSPADAELLGRLVVSCKKLGILYYPNMLAQYCESDLPAYVWVSIEEVKRFNIALYKVCTRCGGKKHSTDPLTTTATLSTELRVQELQFPLPRNTPLWNATTKSEWVSAATEHGYRVTLDDTLELEWISQSAHVLEALEIG
ncbi:hypothetical protein BDV24DRAFT_168161 [Aspergillus arachidicola]|uniref:C2H2 type zinc finger domain protein n=1 Tax=Aspergillus arachidicola TaxID=656916 RepID=A0A5N6XYD7_9EURO|nr:hypothetical protein BDV24DRAFT_168161 [Aspergillus arachidicola]